MRWQWVMYYMQWKENYFLCIWIYVCCVSYWVFFPKKKIRDIAVIGIAKENNLSNFIVIIDSMLTIHTALTVKAQQKYKKKKLWNKVFHFYAMRSPSPKYSTVFFVVADFALVHSTIHFHYYCFQRQWNISNAHFNGKKAQVNKDAPHQEQCEIYIEQYGILR